MILESGGSPTNVQLVNKHGEAKVKSTSSELQHVIAERDGLAFQVIGDFTSVNNSTHTVLHIENTSTTKNLYITFIRVQTVDLAGGTTLPSASTYWQFGYGRTYASGGTAVTPVNTNQSSGKTADATCYDNNATMAGTFTELDRHYVESEADDQSYNKHGALVLGKGNTFEVRLTSDHTSGTAYCRASFFYEDSED
jgi:hypothetical protein